MINWFRFSSPVSFYPLARAWSYWFAVLASLFAGAGLVVAFFIGPTDATQGDGERIIFIHGPAAGVAAPLSASRGDSSRRGCARRC